MFEDPYLGDIVEKTSYDQIYDEHVFYFSAASVSHLFGMHGLELVDVEPQQVHGGSMRYTIAHRGAHPVSERVARQEARERELGLDRPETYARFAENVRKSRDELVALLDRSQAPGAARRRLRRHVEEHDRHEFRRHHARARRVHLGHDADQAGQALARRSHPRFAVRDASSRSRPTSRSSSRGITRRKSSRRRRGTRTAEATSSSTCRECTPYDSVQ